MKRLRNHLRSSEEETQIQTLTNTIGDRRHRDFLDTVAYLEHTEGWLPTVNLLKRTSNSRYNTPIGVASPATQIEPLKYREMIFSLLSCKGFEPVNITTTKILETISETENLIDAQRKILQVVKKAASNQIQKGDSLFFSIDEFDMYGHEILRQDIEKVTMKKLDEMTFLHRDDEYDIEPLWYTDFGMTTLSTLGIKGTWLSREQIDTVLSVIQISNHTKTKLNSAFDSKQNTSSKVTPPSHKDYRLLIRSIINQNLDLLMQLGSRHAITILNPLLNDTISFYNKNRSSTTYASILSLIRAHIRVRSNNSLPYLNQLIDTDDPRLVTPAITAIGNYYCQNSAAILVERICSHKKKQVVELMLTALENIYERLPEVEVIIGNAIDSRCRNRGRLKRLQRKYSNKEADYYNY